MQGGAWWRAVYCLTTHKGFQLHVLIFAKLSWLMAVTNLWTFPLHFQWNRKTLHHSHVTLSYPPPPQLSDTTHPHLYTSWRAWGMPVANALSSLSASSKHTPAFTAKVAASVLLTAYWCPQTMASVWERELCDLQAVFKCSHWAYMQIRMVTWFSYSRTPSQWKCFPEIPNDHEFLMIKWV